MGRGGAGCEVRIPDIPGLDVRMSLYPWAVIVSGTGPAGGPAARRGPCWRRGRAMRNRLVMAPKVISIDCFHSFTHFVLFRFVARGKGFRLMLITLFRFVDRENRCAACVLRDQDRWQKH